MKIKALIFVLSKEYVELTGDDNWISNWEKYMLVRSISSGGAAGEQLVATTRFSCRSWSSCQTHACPSPPPPPPPPPPPSSTSPPTPPPPPPLPAVKPMLARPCLPATSCSRPPLLSNAAQLPRQLMSHINGIFEEHAFSPNSASPHLFNLAYFRASDGWVQANHG